METKDVQKTWLNVSSTAGTTLPNVRNAGTDGTTNPGASADLVKEPLFLEPV